MYLPNPVEFSKLVAKCAGQDNPKSAITWSTYLDSAGDIQHWHLSIVAKGSQKQAQCYRDEVIALGGSPNWPPP